MVEDLVGNLKKDNPELQRHCASAIFKVIYLFKSTTMPSQRSTKYYHFSNLIIFFLHDAGYSFNTEIFTYDKISF